MAKLVLMHLDRSTDPLKAWQQALTRPQARRMSLSSRAGPTIRAPQASTAGQDGTVARTQRYLSGRSSCMRSCWLRSSCRSFSRTSLCSTSAVFNASTASGGKQSGKSTSPRNMPANCSGTGSLLKAIDSSWELLSSSMRTRLRASSWDGARWADDTAFAGATPKCFSMAAGSNGAGASRSAQTLPAGTWFTVVQKTDLNFGPLWGCVRPPPAGPALLLTAPGPPSPPRGGNGGPAPREPAFGGGGGGGPPFAVGREGGGPGPAGAMAGSYKGERPPR
mmetsp:Transcript_7963/g.20209  ORF Transcript_7963/g.20209 Transcript_7963/m.20209 type:complete len:278 (-) Transcript_7963:29-862(-)